jgi:glycosyltransferase involved in cell wall biosynthesis
MAEELGLDPDSSNVYPHGARYVDTETFYPRIPFEKRDTVVGFIGRLDEEKGIRKLAEVAKAMPDDVIFRFVGDGPLYDWLEGELAEEIETGKVEFTGWVDHDDVPRELNKMKLLVMPSQPTEGLPTTILESLACGTPVYATAVGGVTDVVSDNETGFIMTNREVNTMIDEVQKILTRHELDDISRQARTQITAKYDFEAAVERYRQLIPYNDSVN